MSDSQPGKNIEVRECRKCGQEFYGLSGEVAENKRTDHEPTCAPVPENTDDDHRYSPSIVAPRKPEEYQMSGHFHSMKTRRDNPEITSEVVNMTLARGQVKNTGTQGRYIFEWHDGDWLWWVIVKLRDEALRYSDEKHIALTVFAKNSPDHEEVEKYI